MDSSALGSCPPASPSTSGSHRERFRRRRRGTLCGDISWPRNARRSSDERHTPSAHRRTSAVVSLARKFSSGFGTRFDAAIRRGCRRRHAPRLVYLRTEDVAGFSGSRLREEDPAELSNSTTCRTGVFVGQPSGRIRHSLAPESERPVTRLRRSNGRSGQDLGGRSGTARGRPTGRFPTIGRGIPSSCSRRPWPISSSPAFASEMSTNT